MQSVCCAVAYCSGNTVHYSVSRKKIDPPQQRFIIIPITAIEFEAKIFYSIILCSFHSRILSLQILLLQVTILAPRHQRKTELKSHCLKKRTS